MAAAESAVARAGDAVGGMAYAADALDHGMTAGYPMTLAASWAIAFDRLAADDPVALQLLSLLAWLGPEPVPLTLIM